MIKSRYFVLVAIGLGMMEFMSSCNKKPVSNQRPDLYQPSELALLMRKMETENQVIREQIKMGLDSLTYPSAYKALNTSKPTQEGTINETFLAYSAAYEMAMKELQESDSNKTTLFNNGVKACINCHNNFCNGPIERIEKLLIVEGN